MMDEVVIANLEIARLEKTGRLDQVEDIDDALRANQIVAAPNGAGNLFAFVAQDEDALGVVRHGVQAANGANRLKRGHGARAERHQTLRAGCTQGHETAAGVFDHDLAAPARKQAIMQRYL